MQIFIFTLLLFFTFVVLMAVGLFFKRKPISGSCGGLGNLKGIDKVCDCENPCDKAMNVKNNTKIM